MFFKQEHFYHFQELSTYLDSSSLPSSTISALQTRRKNELFLALPTVTTRPSAVTLKPSPDTQWNERVAAKGQHSAMVGGTAAAPEPRQPNGSDRTSVLKTLVVFSCVAQFTPVSNQAAETALAEEEEDVQPFVLFTIR